MASSLSNLVDNFAKITHEMKSKYEHHHENVKRVELNIKTVESAVWNTQRLKMI